MQSQVIVYNIACNVINFYKLIRKFISESIARDWRFSTIRFVVIVI